MRNKEQLNNPVFNVVTKKDPEIKAMEAAVEYMESSEKSARERFIFHLVHRYFPEGRFEPKRFDAPVKLRGE